MIGREIPFPGQDEPGASNQGSLEHSNSLQRVSSMRGLKYKGPVENSVTSQLSQRANNLGSQESCEEFIDNAIEKFHALMFESLPWYCHQRLAEVFLQVLSESAAACRLLYRKWDEAHLYLHHVQVSETRNNTLSLSHQGNFIYIFHWLTTLWNNILSTLGYN